ncbi:UNVERIFIED_CONTAM: hypothetical protein GTU68_052556 [Idotea baltica]|nr:hypothetical protein [Idotea baltica]
MNFARESGETDVDAIDLATVDENGMPNVRIVFMREIEANGFVFYTNYNGKKGQELASGKAAFNLYYKALQRQIRVRGLVEKVSPEQSDRYFLGRPEGSRLGAWVSQQSQVLDSRETMIAEWENLDPDKSLKRPDNWGGFRIIPLEIEFWGMGDFRLHDRFRFTRQGGAGWTVFEAEVAATESERAQGLMGRKTMSFSIGYGCFFLSASG